MLHACAHMCVPTADMHWAYVIGALYIAGWQQQLQNLRVQCWWNICHAHEHDMSLPIVAVGGVRALAGVAFQSIIMQCKSKFPSVQIHHQRGSGDS